MRRNRIYITSILLLSFLSGKAQKIEELTATSLEIGYEKTLHLIFPTEVKYYSIGGDYVIGEKVTNCPEIIRLKAAEENFPGETKPLCGNRRYRNSTLMPYVTMRIRKKAICV